MAQPSYDVIIIGSGNNGLVAANYLAREGLSVLVVERIERIGGAAATEEIFPGFKMPFCAYICYLMQDTLIDELELRKHGYDTYPVDAFAFNPYPDGSYFISWSDARKTLDEVRRFSAHDAANYPDYVAFWERAAGIVHRYFLTDPPTYAQIAQDVRGTPDEEVWETMLTVSIRDLLDEYFEDERVKAAFVHAHDAGDPSAPGSILAVAYPRMSMFGTPENTGIPRGGTIMVAEAMARSARAKGVEIRTSSPVQQIIVEQGQARGVVLASGEEIRSYIIVSNADPKRTYLSLIEPHELDEAFRRRVQNLKARANCVKVLAALKELPGFSHYLGPNYDPALTVYTKICPSVDYFQASWDDCKHGRAPQAPIMSIQIPTIFDKSLAPDGMHVMSSWSLYYPAQLKGRSWEEAKPQIAEQHTEQISQYAPNFRESIIDLVVITPADIEARIGMTNGNIRHIDMVGSQFFNRRMPYRSPIRGLYMCGASTHPGGDLNGAAGYNCARNILKDIQDPASALDIAEESKAGQPV